MPYNAAKEWDDICDADDARQFELESIKELTEEYIEQGCFGIQEDQTKPVFFDTYLWDNCEYEMAKECEIFSKANAAFEAACEDYARHYVKSGGY